MVETCRDIVGLDEPADGGLLALEDVLLLIVGSPERSRLPYETSSSPLGPECIELAAEMRRPRFLPIVTSRSSDSCPKGVN